MTNYSNNTSNITIRPEKASDYLEVQHLIKLAFENTTEGEPTEPLLVKRLRQSDAYIPELSLVAENEKGTLVGHILLSKVKVVSEESTALLLGVAPLSVLPDYQRKGIGSLLMREAHKRASELGYKGALLIGHKEYYPRFGYKKASLYGIQFPFEAPDDCCMAIELKEGGLQGIHGMVHYPSAFYE